MSFLICKTWAMERNCCNNQSINVRILLPCGFLRIIAMPGDSINEWVLEEQEEEMQ